MKAAVDRRTALAAIATLAATPAAASFVVADADPIFAAIARCEGANAEVRVAEADSSRLDAMAESLFGPCSRSNRADFDAITSDSETKLSMAAHQELAAARSFCATVPTTVVGVLAMIEYAGVLASPERDLAPECGEGLCPMGALAKAAKALSQKR